MREQLCPEMKDAPQVPVYPLKQFLNFYNSLVYVMTHFKLYFVNIYNGGLLMVGSVLGINAVLLNAETIVSRLYKLTSHHQLQMPIYG